MNVVALSGVSRNAGGLFYAVSSLCKELHGGGLDVLMMGAGTGLSNEDRAVWGSVPLRTYKALGPLATGLGLRKQLRRSDADLVHQHGIWLDDQWASLQWQIKTGRPVVISPHGMLDPWALRNSAWKKKLVGRLFANESLKSATCIHALCQSEVESIRAYGLKNPVALIPNGVDLPKIDVASSELRTPNRKKKLLFLGRIHPKKGLKELLQAWAKIQGLKPNGLVDWQLIVAGWDNGGHEIGLRTMCLELGIDDSVSFIGAQFGEEKDALFRGVDAFVLPSFSEGLPMSVLEAWSYRLPVLMTPYCNLPEGFSTDAAIAIEPNAESIAQGLGALAYMSVDALMAMGLNGLRLVEQKFTWPRIAEAMRSVYDWCLTKGKCPGSVQFD